MMTDKAAPRAELTDKAIRLECLKIALTGGYNARTADALAELHKRVDGYAAIVANPLPASKAPAAAPAEKETADDTAK